MTQNRKTLKTITRSFAEHFFPARPQQLLRQARELAKQEISLQIRGRAIASNPNYIKWLLRESMSSDARRLAKRYSGQSHMWHNPFARPRPRAAVRKASVWYTAYPISLITKSGESILGSFADPELWNIFREIGIRGLHTGPMKKAGGLKGWETTPSIDGQFDRISTMIDPLFGTEAEFRRMAEVARDHGAIIIDDIVPGHTGKGADFRLAELNYGAYPGIYHMVEIADYDWDVLPDVPPHKDSVNLDNEVEARLKKLGYIVGKLPRVIFYEPGVKDTNWSVTRAVKGVDGVTRRWVYLHYFKDGQPSLNWLDPSFAGMQLVIGDALHSLGELGASGLRLDANGFLGIEVGDPDQPAWAEGHPLSEAANHLIAGTVRKLGSFTFQELNLSIDDIRTMSAGGADLSYDFVNRPAYHHALATGDCEF
jgi:trehalose synthase